MQNTGYSPIPATLSSWSWIKRDWPKEGGVDGIFPDSVDNRV